VLVISILALTPAKEVIFILENKNLLQQEKRIKELETKVMFLSTELEKMASANKRLKYAIFLGITDSVDSNSAVYDSLKYEKKKNLQAEGNIILSVYNFFERLFIQKEPIPAFERPSKGFIVKEFNPKTGHMGIDFSINKGTSVIAAESGLVIFSDYTAKDGNKIIIQHSHGYISIYKHCSVLIKKERDYVVKGEVIALSGNSGSNTTGPHLHFEIWKDGKPLNPKKLLINE